MLTTPHILGAFWETTERGVAYLTRDWKDEDKLPPLLMGDGTAPKLIRRVEPLYFAYRSGYCFDGDTVAFVLCPPFFQNLDWENEAVYVSGDFNGWGEAVGDERWRMQPEIHAGLCVLVLRVPKGDIVSTTERARFKFVTGTRQWIEIPRRAPNAVQDGNNRNFEIQPDVTGKNLFFFWPEKAHTLGRTETLAWDGAKGLEYCEIREGFLLFKLDPDGPQGALVCGDSTVFRLFAPRATEVKVHFRPNRHEHGARTLALTRNKNGVWEGCIDEDLDGWFYYYTVGGENRDATRGFDTNVKVMDPWAKAAIGPERLGMVMREERFSSAGRTRFQPPSWHDLVIAECHVRDVLKYATQPLTDAQRRGFAGLAKCMEDPEFYLRKLGVNAVELQPVQENDAPNAQAYHWGYMPVNFFAPASAYATEPEHGSQVAEFRDMVQAFHKAGVAVILDVVYNHVGEPNHLFHIDKGYYLNGDFTGELTNWSGCGNDLRTYAPNVRRLIIESLVHWVKAYDVDGFRFDLADIVGVATLKEVERALKAVKPSVILIAEPWSFRGHIAHALRHTGFASWNDGYREFVFQYLMGQGNRDGLKYYLGGSQGHLARWPAQSVNYTASHDDYCWIDKITENKNHDGQWPTATDQRRTRLMFALLFMSLGMPMVAQGQDFLHSKRGDKNTYQNGNLNALDYERACDYSDTANYARAWIAFRRGAGKGLLCLSKTPPDTFLRFFDAPHSTTLACLYNADHSHGKHQLLFAVNPHPWSERIPTDGLDPAHFRQLADHNRFFAHGGLNPDFVWHEGELRMPAFSCALYETRQ